jgi:hypothetical protein
MRQEIGSSGWMYIVLCLRYALGADVTDMSRKITSIIECGVLKLCIVMYLEKLIFNWGN